MNHRLERLTEYPFLRLAQLLEGIPPGGTPVDMAVGAPRHAPPAIIREVLNENAALWGRYPPTTGTPALRAAIAGWLKRRYRLPDGMIEADRNVLPCPGTREPLFSIALAVVPESKAGATPTVLIPNPFYQVYAGAAEMAGAEPVFLPATRATGFLPDFASLDGETLERCALAYLCSPTNPQGAVAGLADFERIIDLARRYGFVLAVDECYAEIYTGDPPSGALEACAAGGDLSRVVVFHSLSKRSNAPGLRSGFVAGDAGVISDLIRLRRFAGGVSPLPVDAAAAALWQDEAHVERSRRLYAEKFDLAEAALAGALGFYRPDGGFYLWLEVGDGESAAKRLWEEAGIKALPGGYLGRAAPGEANPGAQYMRVALVHDKAVTEAALAGIARVLQHGTA